MRKQINKSTRVSTVAGVVVPEEGSSAFPTLAKKQIEPVTVTIKVRFNKINIYGTLSGGEVISAAGVSTINVSAPSRQGGCLWVKVADIRAVKLLGDVGMVDTTGPKKPLW